MGILALDDDDRVTEWQEKPKQPKSDLASMGVYVFSKQALRRWLAEDRVDFGAQRHPGHARGRRARLRLPLRRLLAGRRHDPVVLGGQHGACSTTTPSSTCTTRTGSSTPGPRSAPRPRSGPTAQVHRSLISHGCVIDGTVVTRCCRRASGSTSARSCATRSSCSTRSSGRARSWTARSSTRRSSSARAPSSATARRRPAEQAGADPAQHRHHRRRQAGRRPARRAHRAQRARSRPTSARPTSPAGSSAAASRSSPGVDRAPRARDRRGGRADAPAEAAAPAAAAVVGADRQRQGGRRRAPEPPVESAPTVARAISARLRGPCHPPTAAPVRAPGRRRGLARGAGARRPLERADREGIASWDLLLDGRRRFDLRVTVILDPSLALIVWAHYAPPIGDMFRKSYRKLLRWNDEFPFVKFSVAEDERPVLAVELPIARPEPTRSGWRIARILAIADRLLDESRRWLWLGGRMPDPGDRVGRATRPSSTATRRGWRSSLSRMRPPPAFAAPLALVAALGLLAAPGRSRAEVRAATPDLTIVTDARYDVQPAHHRVRVTLDTDADEPPARTRRPSASTSTRRSSRSCRAPRASRVTSAGAGRRARRSSKRTSDYTIVRLGLAARLYSGKSAAYTAPLRPRGQGRRATRDFRIGDFARVVPGLGVRHRRDPRQHGRRSSSRPATRSRSNRARSRRPRRTERPDRLPDRHSQPLTFFAYLVADRPGAYAERR